MVDGCKEIDERGQHKGKGFAVPVPSWGVLEKAEPESSGRGGGEA